MAKRTTSKIVTTRKVAKPTPRTVKPSPKTGSVSRATARSVVRKVTSRKTGKS